MNGLNGLYVDCLFVFLGFGITGFISFVVDIFGYISRLFVRLPSNVNGKGTLSNFFGRFITRIALKSTMLVLVFFAIPYQTTLLIAFFDILFFQASSVKIVQSLRQEFKKPLRIEVNYCIILIIF